MAVEIDRVAIPGYDRHFATRDGRVVGIFDGIEREVGLMPQKYGHRAATISGTSVGIHRLIFTAFNGPIPAGMEIDHIDRNPMNNRPENLRLATRQQNARNNSGQRGPSANVGVSLYKRTNRWAARIRVGRKLYHLGYFETEAEAVVVRKKAAAELFGEFAPQ